MPRRIRAFLAGQTVVDTTHALYVWEWPGYPLYYVPAADIGADLLVDEGSTHETAQGTVRRLGLRVGDVHLPGAATVVVRSAIGGLVDTVRLEWGALDGWFEEDEQVFVHPRSPYVRVDALRSSRSVRVESRGVVLAESTSPVMVFETGLPTRYYVSRTDVDFTHLLASDTVTACPYKGTTSGYWSSRIDGRVHRDVAWAYDFPTRDLLPIAGLIAFYNERLDIFLDGVRLERPNNALRPNTAREV